MVPDERILILESLYPENLGGLDGVPGLESKSICGYISHAELDSRREALPHTPTRKSQWEPEPSCCLRHVSAACAPALCFLLAE